MRRIAFVILALAGGACTRATHSRTAAAECVAPQLATDIWRTFVSPINGVEMSHPVDYVEKRWTNRGSNDPSPSAAKLRVLWSQEDLWLDNRPARRISFGMGPVTNSSYGAAPNAAPETCDVRTAVGTWHARLYESGGPPHGASHAFFVDAQLAVPGDSMVLHFAGSTDDSQERERQLVVLGTFRPTPH